MLQCTRNLRGVLIRGTISAAGALLLFPAASDLRAQPYGSKDPIMGIYEGTWTSTDGKGKVTSQIRSRGDGAYDGYLLLKQGVTNEILIRVVSEGEDATPNAPVRLRGRGAALRNGPARQVEAKIEIARRGQRTVLSGRFTGEMGEGEFQTSRFMRKPPTLGNKPPSGALVLFDGKQINHWENFHFRLMGDGSMQVEKGDLNTGEKLSDFKLHVEFRTPFMPKSEGQARGNSGVYLQSLYEVQVLDSFGLYPLQNNDCGSLYSIKAPDANACLPPMDWQTYDITYQENEAGGEAHPVITVLQNGILIHDQVKVPADKIGKPGPAGNPKGGFLMLQDHGNPVQYRNIWVVPLKKSAN